MYCPECGTELPEKSKFCFCCGKKLEIFETEKQTQQQIATPEIQSPVEIVNEVNSGKEEPSETFEQTPAKKTFNSFFGIGACLLAIIGFFSDPPLVTFIISFVALGLGIFSLLKHGKLKAFPIIAFVFCGLNMSLTFFALQIGSADLLHGNIEKEEIVSEKTESPNTETIIPTITETPKLVETPSPTPVAPPLREYADINTFKNGISIGGYGFEIPEGFKIGEMTTNPDYVSLEAEGVYCFLGVNDYENVKVEIYFDDRENLKEMTEEIAKATIGDENKDWEAQFEEETYDYYDEAAIYTRKYSVKQKNKLSGEQYSSVIRNKEDNVFVISGILILNGKEEETAQKYKEMLSSIKKVNYESPKRGGQSNQSDNNTNTSDIDVNLKEFLDSYEAFIDEYCDFMKKYYSGDTTNYLSMLNEYSDMLEKLTEFQKKADGYDQSKMSAADLEYYLDAIMRIEKKMLEVLN